MAEDIILFLDENFMKSNETVADDREPEQKEKDEVLFHKIMLQVALRKNDSAPKKNGM